MNSFKQKCIELRKLNCTLLEIMKKTGRSKTSVYYHIKDIPLSPSKLYTIKLNAGLRISAISTARKGKSDKAFKKFSSWNADLVNLLSHLMFDGEIKTFGCTYNNRNLALLKTVETLMRLVYEFKPKKYLNSITGVWRFSYNNVALAAFLKEKSLELLEKINSLPNNFKREFLRAFFDDEGCIDFNQNRRSRRIRGYQKNIKILLLIQRLLSDFNIKSAIHKPNEVVITGKENLIKFQGEINFSSGVYINGNRSNSIWKKSLEKSFLLNRAIKSFKN